MEYQADAMTRPSAGTALLAVLAFAVAVASRPAAALHENPAQDKPFAPLSYLAFGGFYEDPDTTRGVDSGLGSNYGYGRSFAGTRAWELRLFGATLETGEAGRTDFYQYGVGVDVFQHFFDIAASHPYLVGGLGAVLNDVDPDDADGGSGYASLGAGWRFAPIANWGVRPRVDLRAVYDTFDAGDGTAQTDLLLGVTLEIPAERERIVVQEKVVEVEKIVEVIKEVPVVPVAMVDRDGDGIADDADQCPDTVGGAKVEADGCVRKAQVVALPNIEFAYEKADLTEAGRETLGQVVRFMNDQAEIALDVWGHTDAKGAELYNLRLSQKRAAAVMKYLVEQGIAESRLKSAGFGESRPLADNETDEGRERNRRVELNIRARAGGQP
jgi:OmpA-OmpF porin, OOP family